MTKISNAPKAKKLLSQTTSNGEIAFPWKLHNVLEESELHGLNDIISWQGDKAFKVHDAVQFEDSVMKEYFNQTQYKSFQRQLNIYGFERVTGGKHSGSYTHKFLVRGKPDICRFMIRTKIKKKGIKGKKLNKTKGAAATTTFIRGRNSRDPHYTNHVNISTIYGDENTTRRSKINNINPTPVSSGSINLTNKSYSIHAWSSHGVPNQLFPNIVPCDNAMNINDGFLDAKNGVFLNGNRRNSSSSLLSILTPVISNEDDDASLISSGNNSNRLTNSLSFHQQEDRCFYEESRLLPDKLELEPMPIEKMKQISRQERVARSCCSFPKYQEHAQNLYDMELDLDTIFEDDANHCQNNNRSSSYRDVDPSRFNPFPIDAGMSMSYNFISVQQGFVNFPKFPEHLQLRDYKSINSH